MVCFLLLDFSSRTSYPGMAMESGLFSVDEGKMFSDVLEMSLLCNKTAIITSTNRQQDNRTTNIFDLFLLILRF